jgi:hypothetical protein
MSNARVLAGAAGMGISVLLLTSPSRAQPTYLFWTASQMADLDKKLLSSKDATEGSRVDMMSTDHSHFLVTHRESSAPSGEAHRKFGDFGVVRSGEGGILAGGKLVDATEAESG